MSGRIVHRSTIPHECAPGWEWREAEEADAASVVRPFLPPLPGGARYGVPPDSARFPRGTVWGCDCGRTWVSQGSPYENFPGFCEWKREGLFARWLRKRRTARELPERRRAEHGGWTARELLAEERDGNEHGTHRG